MRLATLIPLADGETGCYIRDAARSLGHTVLALEPRGTDPWALRSQILAFEPDLVLMSKEVQLLPLIALLRGQDRLASPWVVWLFDVRDMMAEWDGHTGLFRATDGLFTIARGHIEEFQYRYGLTKVAWLSEACDPMIHRPYKPEELTDAEREEFDCDVAFVGGLGRYHMKSTDRGRVLEALRMAGLRVKHWGHSEGAIRYLRNEDLSKLSSVAKIVLCASAWPQVDGSWSARIYRHMGAGAFCLEVAVTGIEKWFRPQWDMDVYSSPDEAVEKARAWLVRDGERQMAGQAAYERTRERHTFAHRLETLFAQCREWGLLPAIEGAPSSA